VDLFHIDLYFHAGFNGKVSEIIVDGDWNLPLNFLVNEVIDRLPLIPHVPLPDTLVLPHSTYGNLSSKNAVAFLKPLAPHMPWADMIWTGCIPPFHSFTFWRLMHRKMPIDENLRTRGCIVVSACCFCLYTDKTSDHLFLRCPFAMELLTWLGGKLNRVIDCASALSILSCIPTRCSSQVADIYLASIIHTVHTIWLSRNSIQFSSKVATVQSAKVKIHSLSAMSGNVSAGNCLYTNLDFLDSFVVPAHCRTVKEIIPVL